MSAVAADDLPHVHRFVRGLDTDHTAIRNGLTLPYSSGAVEGHVNRIEMLTRQMYGRAGFDLLRNEYFSAIEAFRIDHGKWARTRFRPSFTLKNKVTLFPGVTLSLTGLVALDLICPPGHGSANRPGLA